MTSRYKLSLFMSDCCSLVGLFYCSNLIGLLDNFESLFDLLLYRGDWFESLFRIYCAIFQNYYSICDLVLFQ